MKRAIFTFALCAMLAAGVDAETKIADCARENVTDVGLLDGKTPVVCYYTEEEGLISMVRKYYVDIGGRTEGPYDERMSLEFSNDGKVLSYGKYGAYYVVIGNEKMGPYEWVWDIKLLTDGKTLTYRAEIDGKQYDITGGKKSEAHKTIVSRDGKTLAHREKEGWYVSLGGKESGPYDDVSNTAIAPDGKTYAFMALSGNSLYVITGERKEGPYSRYFGLYEIADKLHICFSPDSKTLAYIAERNVEHYVVSNGEESGPYQYGNVNNLMFSPDSKTLAYVVNSIMDRDEYVVVGKEKSETYKEVHDLTFSPNGKLLAYTARANNNKIDGEYYVVAGKEKAGPYSEIRNLTFSPDSKRLTYIAKQYDKDHECYVFSGMEKMGPYRDARDPVFLPDGKLPTYAAIVEGNWYIIKNGEKIGPYDGIRNLMLSPDGETLVYKAVIADRWHCIVEGEDDTPGYEQIFPIMFLNDGKEVAYWAEDDSGSWYLVCGKDVDGPYDSQKNVWDEYERKMQEYKLYTTRLSPDGKKLVYCAKKDGKWYLVVGKDKVGPHDDISWPTFSSDGDIFGYSVETKDEPSRKYVLIDGTPYLGSICGGRAVYLKDGAIWTR